MCTLHFPTISEETLEEAAEKIKLCHSEARFSPKNLSVDWT